jgi:hypothetical protein
MRSYTLILEIETILDDINDMQGFANTEAWNEGVGDFGYRFLHDPSGDENILDDVKRFKDVALLRAGSLSPFSLSLRYSDSVRVFS